MGLGPHEPEENREVSPKSSKGQNLDLRHMAARGFHAECDRNLRGFQ